MALKLGLVVGMEQAKQKNPKGGEWYFLPVKRERSLTAKEEEKGAAAAATGRHFGPARGFEAHLYEGLSAASLNYRKTNTETVVLPGRSYDDRCQVFEY